MVDYMTDDSIPQVLKTLVKDYLRNPKVYPWYACLIKDVEESSSLRMIYLMPLPKLLEYTDILLEDHSPERFLPVLEVIRDQRKQALPIAGFLGLLEVIKYFCKQDGEYNVPSGFNDAAYGGHLKVVEYLISRDLGNFGSAFFHAMSGGHFELVDYFTSKGADPREGFLGAASGGHLDMMIALRHRIPLE